MDSSGDGGGSFCFGSFVVVVVVCAALVVWDNIRIARRREETILRNEGPEGLRRYKEDDARERARLRKIRRAGGYVDDSGRWPGFFMGVSPLGPL